MDIEDFRKKKPIMKLLKKAFNSIDADKPVMMLQHILQTKSLREVSLPLVPYKSMTGAIRSTRRS